MIKIRRIETCCLREFIINVHTSRRTIARVERPQSAVSSRFSWRRNRRIGRWRTFFLSSSSCSMCFREKFPERERWVTLQKIRRTQERERERERIPRKSVDGSIPRERERENREKLEEEEEEEEEGKEREKKSAHLNCRVCVLKQCFNMKSSVMCELFSQSWKINLRRFARNCRNLLLFCFRRCARKTLSLFSCFSLSRVVVSASLEKIFCRENILWVKMTNLPTKIKIVANALNSY